MQEKLEPLEFLVENWERIVEITDHMYYDRLKQLFLQYLVYFTFIIGTSIALYFLWVKVKRYRKRSEKKQRKKLPMITNKQVVTRQQKSLQYVPFDNNLQLLADI